MPNFNSINEINVMSKIVESNYKDLLKNPLAEVFLHMKWQLIDSLFYSNVGFYATFLIMLTTMTGLLGDMSKCIPTEDPEHFTLLNNCSEVAIVTLSLCCLKKHQSSFDFINPI